MSKQKIAVIGSGTVESVQAHISKLLHKYPPQSAVQDFRDQSVAKCPQCGGDWDPGAGMGRCCV